ncbi:DUF6463 family protein [Streptomyces roseolilacinus]|uniref:Uncharacterized protein n=1 Tax=Streptomyces roseolilacinus TaxID=66904 RepID=A0A918ELH1_9ACTN|nr:DUF6463 family protein [Streptomyces roseolilacinus]GGQ07892.1 hypothetical protein GCM10010249_27860 [Streptomyces roseolilacinus]
MNGPARWTPRLIIVTAVLHFAWAFVQPHDWAGIARDGFFRTTADTGAPEYFAREASVWFMACGVTFLALGTLAHHALRTTGRLPAQIGWYLLGLGIPLCVFAFPLTGGWALVALGVLALVASRRTAPARTPGQDPP